MPDFGPDPVLRTPEDTTPLRARARDRSGWQDQAVPSVGSAPFVMKQLARLLARQAAREWLRQNREDMEHIS
jgi:hypothetical protein